MANTKWLYGTIVASLILTGCVSSQKLVTPPLYLKNAEVLYCTAVNLHSTDKTIDIRVFDEHGNQRCGAGPRTLAPGRAESQLCNSDLHIDSDPIRYCVFTYDGYAGKVVGSGQIDPPEGEAVTAVPVPVSSPACTSLSIPGGEVMSGGTSNFVTFTNYQVDDANGCPKLVTNEAATIGPTIIRVRYMHLVGPMTPRIHISVYVASTTDGTTLMTHFPDNFEETVVFSRSFQTIGGDNWTASGSITQTSSEPYTLVLSDIALAPM